MKNALFALPLAALLVPAFAQAQTRYDQPQYEEPTYNHNPMGPSVDIQAGTGLMHYGRSVANELDNGIGYDGILTITPQRNISLEAAYAGGVNQVDSKFSASGSMVTNQFGGNLRLNLVPATYDLPGHLRPFIFGGIAWVGISTYNFTPGIVNGSGLAVPAGLGLDAAIGGGFLVGARFTYNWMYNVQDQFAGRVANYWNVGINLGAHFGA